MICQETKFPHREWKICRQSQSGRESKLWMVGTECDGERERDNAMICTNVSFSDSIMTSNHQHHQHYQYNHMYASFIPHHSSFCTLCPMKQKRRVGPTKAKAVGHCSRQTIQLDRFVNMMERNVSFCVDQIPCRWDYAINE